MTAAATANDLGLFGQRLNGLEKEFAEFRNENAKAFGKVEQMFDRLSGEFRAKSTTPWGLLISGASLLFLVTCGIGGAVYYPVKEEMARLAIISDKLVDSRAGTKDLESSDRSNDRRFQKVEQDIVKLQNDVVSRSELSHVWEMQDARMAGIERRGDELRGQVFSSAQGKR